MTLYRKHCHPTAAATRGVRYGMHVRIAVLSDVHSNLVALRAVLDDCGTPDAIWCLGDIVGYGPRPNDVIALLVDRGALAVAGNHDWAAVGKMGVETFNRDAATAARWTSAALSPEARDYLTELEVIETAHDCTLVHGSPRDPLWEYLLASWQALENLDHFATRLCLFGHTHIPSMFASVDEGRMRVLQVEGALTVELTALAGKTFLNPGSVGQPRDGDPRSAYLLLDLSAGSAEWRRVPYDIEATQAQMREARLPRRLIERLSQGY